MEAKEIDKQAKIIQQAILYFTDQDIRIDKIKGFLNTLKSNV